MFTGDTKLLFITTTFSQGVSLINSPLLHLVRRTKSLRNCLRHDRQLPQKVTWKMTQWDWWNVTISFQSSDQLFRKSFPLCTDYIHMTEHDCNRLRMLQEGESGGQHYDNKLQWIWRRVHSKEDKPECWHENLKPKLTLMDRGCSLYFYTS